MTDSSKLILTKEQQNYYKQIEQRYKHLVDGLKDSNGFAQLTMLLSPNDSIKSLSGSELKRELKKHRK